MGCGTIGYDWKQACLPGWKGDLLQHPLFWQECKCVFFKKAHFYVWVRYSLTFGERSFLIGGMFIRTFRVILIIIFTCLLTACSCSEEVPEYIHQLAADGESIDRLEEHEGESITAVYAVGVKGETPRMVAQEASAPGFADMIKVLVLIDVSTGLTEKVQILEHHETEDYGGYVTEEWFLGRFAGKDAGTRLNLVKIAAHSSGDIVAITGATYTSRAVVDIVNSCLENYRKIIEEVEW